MTDMALPEDPVDIIGEYFDRRPVQAVHLSDPNTMTRAGRWITQHGGRCSWVAAHSLRAEEYAGAVANRLTLMYPEGHMETAVMGDWIIFDRFGRFTMLTNEEFREIYQPTVKGELTDELP